MSSHSHRARLQMMEKTKRLPQSGNYSAIYEKQPAPSIISSASTNYNPTPSVLSGTSSKINPKNLKLYSQRPKSHENLYAESVLSEDSSRYPGSYAQRSFKSNKAGSTSALGQRINSKMSLASMSRSLNASRASLASQKSTIQQEYHDIKVQRKINAPWFGSAYKPFMISIILYTVSFILLFIGILILFLRGFWNIFLTHDIGEMLGPMFIVGAILLLAIAIRFSLVAYRISCKERLKIRFRGDDYNKVNATTKQSQNKPSEKLVTGTNTNKAISRQLMTSSRNELQLV